MAVAKEAKSAKSEEDDEESDGEEASDAAEDEEAWSRLTLVNCLMLTLHFLETKCDCN